LSNIEGYGEYMWAKASTLRDIPKLPDELFDMITSKSLAPPPAVDTAARQLPALA
jgi:hypothetical protein